MVIGFFASNPIFLYKQDGRPKSEDRCIGHFSFLSRFIPNYLFTEIISYFHKEQWVFIITSKSNQLILIRRKCHLRRSNFANC